MAYIGHTLRGKDRTGDLFLGNAYGKGEGRKLDTMTTSRRFLVKEAWFICTDG